MGKIVYNAAIDHVSGAVQKPRKRAGHICGAYIVATHRTAPSENPNCNRIYFKPTDAYERTTAVGADELAARLRFATVAAAVLARSKDLTKIAADKAAFEEQKNTAGGKKTLKAWYWKVEGEAYDAQN